MTPVLQQLVGAITGVLRPLITPSRVAMKACENALKAEGPEALPLILARVEIDQSKREIAEALAAVDAAALKCAESVERLMSVSQSSVERLPEDMKRVIAVACAEGARRVSHGGSGIMRAS